MDIKIGVTQIARELEIETSLTAEEVLDKLQDAKNGEKALVLESTNGRKLVIPTEKIGYIDIGSQNQRPVGFGV